MSHEHVIVRGFHCLKLTEGLDVRHGRLEGEQPNATRLRIGREIGVEHRRESRFVIDDDLGSRRGSLTAKVRDLARRDRCTDLDCDFASHRRSARDEIADALGVGSAEPLDIRADVANERDLEGKREVASHRPEHAVARADPFVENRVGGEYDRALVDELICQVEKVFGVVGELEGITDDRVRRIRDHVGQRIAAEDELHVFGRVLEQPDVEHGVELPHKLSHLHRHARLRRTQRREF